MAQCKSMMCVATVLAVASVTMAAEPSGSVSGLFDLQSATAVAGPALFAAQEETTMTMSSASSEDDTLDGPYFLRSADPLAPGLIEFKLVYGYETSSGESDEHEVGYVFEWGIADNIELIIEGGAVVGNGAIEGNGDIEEIGFHTRFWEEDGWMPAFAMRNFARLPTGYHSSGVDYLGIGLFTWTLDPGVTRLHFNPFVKSVNGDNGDDDERNFQWGAALGVEHRFNDDLKLIIDYKNTSSSNEGARNNHSIEIGGDWEIAPGREIGFSTEIGIDGDENGPNFGAQISYIIEVG